MRLVKIGLFVIIAIYGIFFGVNDIKGCISYYSLYSENTESYKQLLIDKKDIENQLTEQENQIIEKTGGSIESLNNKEEVTDNILDIKDVELVSITAINISGGIENIVSTINSKEDIVNFDDSINCIEYSIKCKDTLKTLESLQNLNMFVSKISTSPITKTITFRVIFPGGGVENA